MKLIDYMIIAAVIGVFWLSYAGFRIEAVLLGAVILIVASWRFYDASRDNMSGASGHDCPDHPDSIYGSHHSAAESGDADAGGD